MDSISCVSVVTKSLHCRHKHYENRTTRRHITTDVIAAAAATYMVDVQTFPFFPNCKEKRIITNTNTTVDTVDKSKTKRQGPQLL